MNEAYIVQMGVVSINTKFEEVLIKESLISLAQLDYMKEQCKDSGIPITEVLINNGMINKKTIISILESKFNISYVDLDNTEIDYGATELITKEIAAKHCAFAYRVQGKYLLVVMANPFDLLAINSIKFVSGKEIRTCVGNKEQIVSYVEKYYERQSTERVLEGLKSQEFYSLEEDTSKQASDEIHNAPVVRLVDYIINQSVLRNASDIHIEPFEKLIRVRLRVDGTLTELIELPIKIQAMVLTRIKIMSNLEISEKRTPQDGKFQHYVKEIQYDFRVSIIPTVYGEKIVIRILYKNGIDLKLEALGFENKNITIINEILMHSSGMVLITGPTGSGKSTTLYSMLNLLNKNDKNIITIEDPVECFLFGINQINVNSKVGLNFASGLRSMLRQDPDIIMVGEIRDTETAEIAVRAAITGHLVISTLHTRDAPGSISRLKEMGVPNYLLSDSLIAVIAQRLVRKICPFCKYEYSTSDIEIKYLRKHMALHKGAGCNKCNNTGYSGRMAVYEIMYIDESQRRIIASSGNVDKIREYACSQGINSLKDECLTLLEQGITTFDEYLKLAYD